MCDPSDENTIWALPEDDQMPVSPSDQDMSSNNIKLTKEPISEAVNTIYQALRGSLYKDFARFVDDALIDWSQELAEDRPSDALSDHISEETRFLAKAYWHASAAQSMLVEYLHQIKDAKEK